MATATVREPVKMTDGRTVEFTPKQKLVKSHAFSDDGVLTVTLDFRNGETRSFQVLPGTPIFARLAAHGAEQKLGDAIAGEENIDDGIASVDDLIARLDKGEWTAGREKGAFTGVSTLLRAIVALGGKTLEDAKAYLSGKSAAEKTALRKHPTIAAEIAKIEAEKPKKASTVDTGAILADLGIE